MYNIECSITGVIENSRMLVHCCLVDSHVRSPVMFVGIYNTPLSFDLSCLHRLFSCIRSYIATWSLNVRYNTLYSTLALMSNQCSCLTTGGMCSLSYRLYSSILYPLNALYLWRCYAIQQSKTSISMKRDNSNPSNVVCWLWEYYTLCNSHIWMPAQMVFVVLGEIHQNGNSIMMLPLMNLTFRSVYC